MGNFLETYNPLKLSQEKAESLTRPISAREIERVIKNSKHTKVLDQTVSQENFAKHLEKSYPQFFSNYSKKNPGRGMTPNSFSDASIILIPKPH